MKRIFLLGTLLTLLIIGTASGQQIDFALGVNGLQAPGTSHNSSGVYFPSLGGGTYLGFSGDVLITHHFGVEGELFWKASQGDYGGYLPYRPLFYDFNAIWAPPITKRITAELLAGIGAESLRFYTPNPNCNYYSCTNYFSSNHFMGDVGGGIRLYVWHSVFVRPEARLYLINNNVEFNTGRALRYGMSIGYSFGH